MRRNKNNVSYHFKFIYCSYMEELLSLVVSDPIVFDLSVFSLWLEGKTLEVATAIKISSFLSSVRMRQRHSKITPNVDEENFYKLDPHTYELFKKDILDQYRMFEILEHYLAIPSSLSGQTMVQVPAATQRIMIENYYKLDDIIVREILNRKMSKNRKDLDEISESCDRPLVRVTREYGNLRRIVSASEERTGNIYKFIQGNYVLPAPLARKYTCLLFLINGKFNLSTTKKIAKVSCASLELCAALTMSCLVMERTAFYENWR